MLKLNLGDEMIKNEVFIRKESDGYRAYWSHRSWDCVKHDNKLSGLTEWLDKLGFKVRSVRL